MNYKVSELDTFYHLNLNCATHYGDMKNPQGMLNPHHHNDYEIYFLAAGHRKYFIQNTIYTLNPNQIVIFKPKIPHQVTFNLNIPYVRHLVYVTPKLFSEVLDSYPSLKNIVDVQLFNLSESNFAEALKYIARIDEELERNDPHSQDSIKLIIAEMLIFINRHNDTSNLVLNKGDIRIQNAIDYILEHYNEPISLDDCAKIACMDYYTFSKTFHKLTSFKFKEFLNNIRIDKGRELLENTSHPITKIAELVGFSSDTHFSTTFKAFYGISPTNYRSEFKNKNNSQN